MKLLIGTYECKADAKGRLLFPKAFKRQLSSVLHEGFVIKRSVFQPCLEVYPKNEWNTLLDKMQKKLNPFLKKHNDFIRRFQAGVKEVELDASGRILIPKDLCAFAEINKQTVLSSAMNSIEIWDKNNYEATINDATQNFANLAEEVMGNFNDNDIS